MVLCYEVLYPEKANRTSNWMTPWSTPPQDSVLTRSFKGIFKKFRVVKESSSKCEIKYPLSGPCKPKQKMGQTRDIPSQFRPEILRCFVRCCAKICIFAEICFGEEERQTLFFHRAVEYLGYSPCFRWPPRLPQNYFLTVFLEVVFLMRSVNRCFPNYLAGVSPSGWLGVRVEGPKDLFNLLVRYLSVRFLRSLPKKNTEKKLTLGWEGGKCFRTSLHSISPFVQDLSQSFHIHKHFPQPCMYYFPVRHRHS